MSLYVLTKCDILLKIQLKTINSTSVSRSNADG